MAYIGQQPFQEFSSVPTKDSFTGDGSTTTFDLANDVVRGAENAIEVFVDLDNITEIKLSTIGNDMTQDQREKAQEVVVPVILTRIVSIAAFVIRKTL